MGAQEFSVLPNFYPHYQVFSGIHLMDIDSTFIIGGFHNNRIADTNGYYRRSLVKYNVRGEIVQSVPLFYQNEKDSTEYLFVDMTLWKDTLWGFGYYTAATKPIPPYSWRQCDRYRIATPFDRKTLTPILSKTIKSYIGRTGLPFGPWWQEDFKAEHNGFKLFSDRFPLYDISSDSFKVASTTHIFNFNLKTFHRRIGFYSQSEDSNNVSYLNYAEGPYVFEKDYIVAGRPCINSDGVQECRYAKFDYQLRLLDTFYPKYDSTIQFGDRFKRSDGPCIDRKNTSITIGPVRFKLGSKWIDSGGTYIYNYRNDSIIFDRMIETYTNTNRAKAFTIMNNIVRSSDGNYFYARYRYGLFTWTTRFFEIFKLDTSFNIIWRRTYSENHRKDTIYYIFDEYAPLPRAVPDLMGGMAFLIKGQDNTYETIPQILWVDKDGNPRKLKGIDLSQDTTKPVSISSAYQDEQITLYPNPAQNELFIRFNGAQGPVNYIIYSQEGRTLQFGNIESNRILTNNLANGVYIMHIESRHQVTKRRIEIQR